jgi:L-asparaginase
VGTRKIVVLGTGGTLAGQAKDAGDNVGYTAAQIGVAQLLGGITALKNLPIVSEQIAQIDSKDMTTAIWRDLAARCRHWLAQDDVAGVVVTHGTDTVEETAFFLQQVLAASKPVVLTCAMRPATSLNADGPQNIVDAVTVASSVGARGVVVVCAGHIHDARAIAKVHHYRLDPFSSGDAGPAGLIENGEVQLFRAWPEVPANADVVWGKVEAASRWPHVEIVMSHAGATGSLVEAVVARGVDGLVVAGTGNGTVHQDLFAALLAAQAAGVNVVRATRCAEGRVIAQKGDAIASTDLSPVKARIELMLQVIGR